MNNDLNKPRDLKELENPEESISRVMAGLRDVEPSADLRDRILAAMAAQQEASIRPASRWFGSSRFGSWSRGATFAGFTFLCLGFWAVVHHQHQPSIVANLQPVANPPTQPVPRPFVPTARLQRLPGARSMRSAPATKAAIKVPQPGQDSATFAASFPAPPLPLTDQEKLLVRLVHKGDPVQMAMLNPERRAREQAEGKAEFQHFFEPETTGESK